MEFGLNQSLKYSAPSGFRQRTAEQDTRELWRSNVKGMNSRMKTRRWKRQNENGGERLKKGESAHCSGRRPPAEVTSAGKLKKRAERVRWGEGGKNQRNSSRLNFFKSQNVLL